MLASFRAVFYKEWLHIRRDRMTLVLTLVMPMIQMMLYGWMDTNVRHIPTVVADASRSVESRRLIDELRATGSFDIAYAPSPAAARAAVLSARARVAVLVPPDYHDRIVRGQTAQVLVLVDGSESSVASTAVATATGVALSESVRRLMQAGGGAAPIEARPVVLFNPDSRSANYLIPGLVAVLLQMVTTLLTAIAIVRERERGTLEQLLVTPVEPVGLMLGKVAPYLVVGVAEVTIILTVMRVVFGVPIHGSLVFLYVMALVYIFACLSIGLYISIGAKTEQAAQATVQLTFLPSIFLSGYIFPSASLPLPLRYLGQLFPVTHFIEIMRGVVLRGAGPLALWRSCAALVVISVTLIAASARRFKRVSL